MLKSGRDGMEGELSAPNVGFIHVLVKDILLREVGEYIRGILEIPHLFRGVFYNNFRGSLVL